MSKKNNAAQKEGTSTLPAQTNNRISGESTSATYKTLDAETFFKPVMWSYRNHNWKKLDDYETGLD